MQSSRFRAGRRGHVWALAAALAASTCGLQEHIGDVPPLPPEQGGYGGFDEGSGGDASGGAGGGSGGAANRSGGAGGARSADAGAGGKPGSAGGSGGSATRDAGAPVPPGPGVIINGVKVPKDKAIVFIHWGHSNMAGRAQDPPELQSFFFTPQARLWSYQGNGRFVPAKEPTVPDSSFQTTAGPGMALLRTALAKAGPDYHFISVGRGQGSATTEDYLKGGLYYSTFMDKAMELKGNVTFGAMFIMMGITDRHLPDADQSGFPDRMVQIIADIRRDLGEPNLPVLHTEYEVTATGDLAITAPIGMKFQPLVAMLPGKVRNLVLVPTADLPLEDDHHFNFIGQKTWSERAIQLMVDRGWFLWAK